MKWNLTSIELDRSIRNEYLANAQNVRVSPITGNAEPYVSSKVFVVRYGLSYVSILLMALILFGSLLSIVVYRIKVLALAYTLDNNYLRSNLAIIASVTGSIFTVIAIKTIIKTCKGVSYKLTVMECHRTQTLFENSLVYKTFIINFVVSYSFFFYLTFFKENFYTHPSDENIKNSLFGLRGDKCTPAGCLIDLSVQLFFLFFHSNVKNNLMRLITIRTSSTVRKLRKRRLKCDKLEKRWEYDFFLTKNGPHDLIECYTDLTIQYAAVTLFAVAFPLAPLLAFLNNVIMLRVHAIAFTKDRQRPVAHRVGGIGAWNVILKYLTFLGVTVNICIIAFCTDTLPKILQHLTGEKHLPFILRHYSHFEVSDFGNSQSRNVSYCYYRGDRYPPWHPEKYQLTARYWKNTVMKLTFVFVFEHLLLALKVVLMIIIPDIPSSIREKMIHEERKYKGTKMRILNEDYMRQLV